MAFQPVEVAVTVVARARDILAVYNPKWGSFTLPMTKRKKWQDPKLSFGVSEEEWAVAASRAAAEITGKTLSPKEFPQHLLDIKEYRQSGEDGLWKVYSFQIFAWSAPEATKPVEGVMTEWLAPHEFSTRQPVSSTARYLIAALEKSKLLPPWP